MFSRARGTVETRKALIAVASLAVLLLVSAVGCSAGSHGAKVGAAESFVALAATQNPAYAVAFDHRGGMFMVLGDNYGNGNVYRVAPSGKATKLLDIKGSFIGPGADVDAAGNLYVAAGDRILEIKPKGKVETTLVSYHAFDLRIDCQGRIYVADDVGNAVHRYAGDLRSSQVVARGESSGAPFTLTGIAFDRTCEHIYLAESSAGQVVRYALGKNGRVGKPEVVASGLTAPTGIAVDDQGMIWVDSSSGNTVARISADGAQELFDGAGKITGPIGMKLGDEGFDRASLYLATPLGIVKVEAG